MFCIKKTLKTFSAAHRLNKDYTGRCRDLHGHNYRTIVVLGATKLDRYDFVMDFGDIKTLFERWLYDHWDHVTLVSDLDQELLDFVVQAKQRHYVLDGGRNTTAECLAQALFDKFSELLAEYNSKQSVDVQLVELELAETDGNVVVYRG